MTGLRFFAAALFLAVLSGSALAQSTPASNPSLLFAPADAKPVEIALASLAALPQVEQDISFKTSKGMSTARYKGPLLWDVVKASKMLDGLEHNKELAKTLLVTAGDGYQIAFSIGELAPEFGNATIMLALETDGKPMPDGFRIVAQGDKRGARAIHDITRIELR